MGERNDVFTTKLTPNLQFSSTVKIPNSIKVRKKVEVWPVKFSAGLDYNFARDKLRWVASCKEKLFDGRISLDLNAKTINYSKNVVIEGGPSFCLQAQCPYGGSNFAPTFGINFLSGNGSRRVMSVGSNSFDLRTKIPISRRVRAEVCGNVKLPMLAPQYSVASNTLSLSEDGMFEIHVAEVNAILYV